MMNTRTTNNAANGLLTAIRAFHSISLVIIAVATFILTLLPDWDYVPVFDSTDGTLRIIEICFYVVAVICLITGLYLPRLLRRFRTTSEIEREIFYSHILRLSFFISLAIYGMVMKFLGSDWFTVLPLIGLAVIALVLTFPTNRRWAKWKTEWQ